MVNLPRQDDKLLPSSKEKKSQLQRQQEDLRSTSSRSTSSESIKAVAIYEVVKGVGSLIGVGALWWWHANLDHWLTMATASWHDRFGQFLAPQVESAVHIAQQASKNWGVFLLLIVGYAVLRFVEAYGLWQDRTWAYWFGVLGYVIFIPIEVYYLIVSPFDWFKLGILVLNLLIVFVVYRNMKRKGLI